jgi:aminopeptidase
MEPIRGAHMETRWVYTVHPTAAGAQRAGMSTASYEAFARDAVDRDRDAQHRRQRRLASALEAGERPRLRTGRGTDLRMSIADNPVESDYGLWNLPGGEVSTAPVPDSVEGTVAVDFPTLVDGREVGGARLTFEDGEVVAFDADRNEDALAGLLETDDCACRLGELGVGTNRGIEWFTGDTSFDEKMAGTVHVALGRAYADSVDDGNERNASAVHHDVLVDLRTDGTLAVDGEALVRDGEALVRDGEFALD